MSERILAVGDITFYQPDPDAGHPTDAAYRMMDRARNPVVPPVPEPPPVASMLIGDQEPVSIGFPDWTRQVDRRVALNWETAFGIPTGPVLFDPEPPLDPDKDIEPPDHVLQAFAVVRRRPASYAAPFDNDDVPRRIQYATVGRNTVVLWGDPVDPGEYVPRRVKSIVAESVGGGVGIFNVANVDFQQEVPPSLAAAVSRAFRQRNKLEWW